MTHIILLKEARARNMMIYGGNVHLALQPDKSYVTTIASSQIKDRDIQYRIIATDKARNSVSTPYYYTYFPADKTAPTGAIKINNGSQYTNMAGVVLKLSVEDKDSGMQFGAQMRLSPDNVTWTQSDYAQIKSWTLSSGDGKKITFGDNHKRFSVVGKMFNTFPYHKKVLKWRGWRPKWVWSELREEALTLQADKSYAVTLTAKQVEHREIKYYITAADKLGNTANTPQYQVKR